MFMSSFRVHKKDMLKCDSQTKQIPKPPVPKERKKDTKGQLKQVERERRLNHKYREKVIH